ncbi:hypothetical protein EBR21_17275, partial [bacterium]|nr:hypothetical protein [bacterium]
MRNDALGAIFRVEKRLGRGDVFELVSHFADGRTHIEAFEHEFHDGLGALLQESAKWQGPRLQLPLFQLKTAASAGQILAGLQGLKEDMTPSQTHWKSLDASAPYTPEHLAWRVFSKQTTLHLLNAAKQMHISLNTLLLATTNKVVAENLLAEDQRDCRWLIPVNMRRNEEDRQLSSNCTSSIGLRFDREASPILIDKKYRSALNKWRAIATHALAHASCQLGEERLLKLAQLRGQKNSWIGSFSNLGVWQFEEQAENPHWPVALSIAPPAGTP